MFIVKGIAVEFAISERMVSNSAIVPLMKKNGATSVVSGNASGVIHDH